MIRYTLKSAEITAEIVIFVVFAVGSYDDSLLSTKFYICSRVNITSVRFKFLSVVICMEQNVAHQCVGN